MKFLSVVVVFTVSLACAQASPAFANSEKLLQECNATYPVQQYSNLKIWDLISSGVGVQLSGVEKCFLLCLFRRDVAFDENVNLRNGKASAYVKDLLKGYPDIAKYKDVLMAQIFQITRSAKSIDDKCERAYVAHHHIILTIAMLQMTAGIEYLHTKDMSKENDYFKFVDDLINEEETWESMKSNTSTTAFCKLDKSIHTTNIHHYRIWHKNSTETLCQLK
ncbi:uncharacterized protein LOC135839217 isoform X2 [Planococcus citri]|uniref:uncharacterized protein LOC135839217 isoform X2 n=1 Tax=Planococcus citri TaxID=170843 RepID=UPI0031F9329C